MRFLLLVWKGVGAGPGWVERLRGRALQRRKAEVREPRQEFGDLDEATLEMQGSQVHGM